MTGTASRHLVDGIHFAIPTRGPWNLVGSSMAILASNIVGMDAVSDRLQRITVALIAGLQRSRCTLMGNAVTSRATQLSMRQFREQWGHLVALQTNSLASNTRGIVRAVTRRPNIRVTFLAGQRWMSWRRVLHVLMAACALEPSGIVNHHREH